MSEQTPVSPDEMRAMVPPECDHFYISKHKPGHLLYWIRQCTICHEVDWADLDREIRALPADRTGPLPRITVDLNVRVRKHETYSAFEDVTGADPPSLRWGDRILAVETEDGICADAFVTGVDAERELVYLAPDWRGWRDDLAITGIEGDGDRG